MEAFEQLGVDWEAFELLVSGEEPVERKIEVAGEKSLLNCATRLSVGLLLRCCS